MLTLSTSLEENIKIIKDLFIKDESLLLRRFANEHDSNLSFAIFYICSMVDTTIVNEYILENLMYNKMSVEDSSPIDYMVDKVIASNNVEKTSDINKIVLSIIDGYTVIILDGYNELILVNTQGWQMRSVEEPSNEKSLRGPREGFTESIMVNLSLLRRKLRTNHLKFQFKTLGYLSKTKICISYIEGRADEKLLAEINNRLDKVHIDGLFEIKYIQELIDDRPYSLFEVMGTTEKPDVLASKLLEGKIAIFMDGSPVATTIPFLFIEYFQTAEDYYINYYFASVGRMLRLWAFFFTTSTPALFLALVTYHKELIPTSLLLSVFASRQGVPFPTVVELLLLLFVFEVLREAGTRMPSDIGQTLSIVGALVLGSAAVDARIVSIPSIIIVGFSGITALMIPTLSGSFVIIRVIFMLLAASLGLPGYLMGVMGLLIHLCHIKSFDMPFLGTLTSLYSKDLKDTVIRGPRWFLAKNNRGDEK